MPRRKNHTSKKSNIKFRKNRSKTQKEQRNRKKDKQNLHMVMSANDVRHDLGRFTRYYLGGKRKTRKTRKSKKRGGGISSSQPAQPPETPPECPICTEESIENCITTQCGHTFHKSCLQPWCRQHRETTTCPACRSPIGRLCRELLFTELEKILFGAIDTGEVDFAEAAITNSINDNGTPKYDNNIMLLDINVKNKDGDTPLILAAKNDQVEIVDMLLKSGADVDELNDDGYAAFHVTDNSDILNLLIEYNTGYYDPTDDVVERNIFRFENRGGKRKTQKKNRKSKKSNKQNGGTNDLELLDAVTQGNIERLQHLLENGANVNAKNNIGITALMLAIFYGHTETVAKLLENGANVNAKENDGETPIIWASQFGQTETVTMLLKNGANVNAKNNNGTTALHFASYNGHTKTVAKLLEKGASVNTQNNDGDTAFHLASENGHIEIVQMLKEIKNKPPRCMSKIEYEKCIPGWDDPEKTGGWPGDAKPTCGISLEVIKRQDAVKFPEQPTVCYDRKKLRQWFNTRKTNPLTRKLVDEDWIDENMGEKPCKPQIEGALPQIA